MLSEAARESINNFRFSLEKNRGAIENDGLDYRETYNLFRHMDQCCEDLFDTDSEIFDQSWNSHSFSKRSGLLADVVVPSSGFDLDPNDSSLKKAVLFSDFCLIVLPADIGGTYTTFDIGAEFQGYGNLFRRSLSLNLKFSSALKNHEIILLPRSIKHYHEGIVGAQSWIRNAPLRQNGASLSYVPYNQGGKTRLELFHSFALPYFEEASLDDLSRIKRNETDAFPRFQYFLRRKIAEMSDPEKKINPKTIFAEIDYEVHRLNIEAEKLSKLSIMRDVSIGTFVVSVVALVMMNVPGAKEIAGVVGTTSLYQIIKDYFNGQAKCFDLKKDDFYIPYLFQRTKKGKITGLK